MFEAENIREWRGHNVVDVDGHKIWAAAERGLGQAGPLAAPLRAWLARRGGVRGG